MHATDLVTGGAGFIGSHMVDALLSKGRRVRVIDNFVNGNKENLSQHKANPHLEIIQIDISNKNSMDGICDGIDKVFHFAAMADIVPSINNPEQYFNANVTGTLNLLIEAKRNNVEKFLYAASSSCYGIPKSYPTKETSKISPEYPYALTKRLGEELVLHWAQVYGVPSIALRLFNVFGPRARTGGTYGAVFGVFLAQLANQQPLTVVGDGTQKRDFTFVSDVVEAFIASANAEISGVSLNVGSGNTYSINHLIKLLGAKDFVHIPKRPGEPECTWADTSLIEELIGWKARISFEDGVKTMLENIKDWEKAPVWNPNSIEEAAAAWFKFLK